MTSITSQFFIHRHLNGSEPLPPTSLCDDCPGESSAAAKGAARFEVSSDSGTMSLGGRIFTNAAAECPSIRETWCSSFYIFCHTYHMPPATPVKPCSHDIEGLLQQDSWGPGLLFGLGGVDCSFLRVLHWPLFHCPAHCPLFAARRVIRSVHVAFIKISVGISDRSVVRF